MKIPVLYYHEVVPQGQGYTYQKIEVQKFEEQLEFITKQGYQSVFFSEAKQFAKQKIKSIIITFDDGFKTVYNYAFPLLKKYRIKATLFLCPKYIEEGHDYYLTWEMIKEMLSSGLIEIGSHTYSHVDVRSVSRERLLEQLILTDNSIKNNLGIISSIFCFPYGVFNKKALNTLDEYSKYEYYVVSYFGRANFRKKNKRVQRLGVNNDDSIETFDRKLKGKESYRGIVQYFRIIKSNWFHKYQEYRIDF